MLLVSVFVLFSFKSGSLAQPVYYTDQMDESLDSFFWKRLLPQVCDKEMGDQEKQQRTSTVSNTTERYGSSMKKSENKKKDLSTNYGKRHSPNQ